jgi:hypothetical protein
MHQLAAGDMPGIEVTYLSPTCSIDYKPECLCPESWRLSSFMRRSAGLWLRRQAKL